MQAGQTRSCWCVGAWMCAHTPGKRASLVRTAAALSDANRKAHGPRDSKDTDSRSRAPKKADKPKSVNLPSPLESAEADASA